MDDNLGGLHHCWPGRTRCNLAVQILLFHSILTLALESLFRVPQTFHSHHFSFYNTFNRPSLVLSSYMSGKWSLLMFRTCLKSGCVVKPHNLHNGDSFEEFPLESLDGTWITTCMRTSNKEPWWADGNWHIKTGFLLLSQNTWDWVIYEGKRSNLVRDVWHLLGFW